RSSLEHLVDHGLVPRLDLDALRTLAASLQAPAKTTDSPCHLVMRMDVVPSRQRIPDNSDDGLSRNVEGPHRLPGTAVRRCALLRVRSFVIDTGHLEGLGNPLPLRTDRRAREITGRTISVSIEIRLSELSSRPSKAVEDARW